MGSVALRQEQCRVLLGALRGKAEAKTGWVFGTHPNPRGSNACLCLWAMKFKKKQDPWDFRLAAPWEDLCGHPSAYGKLFCMFSARMRPEELGDSV